MEVVEVVPFQLREPNGKSHHDFSAMLGNHPTQPQISYSFLIYSYSQIQKEGHKWTLNEFIDRFTRFW